MLDVVIVITVIFIFILVNVAVEMLVELRQGLEKREETLRVIMRELDSIKRLQAEMLLDDRRYKMREREIDPMGYTE